MLWSHFHWRRQLGLLLVVAMGKTAEIPLALRERVVNLHAEGTSVRKIAKQLDLKRSTVHNIIKKFERLGEIANIEGRGRKKKTTERTDRFIKELAMKNRRMSAKDIPQKS